jgi:hypothetical protein
VHQHQQRLPAGFNARQREPIRSRWPAINSATKVRVAGDFAASPAASAHRNHLVISTIKPEKAQ